MKRVLQIGMSPNYGGTEAVIMTAYRFLDRDSFQFDFLNVYDCPIACEEEICSLGGQIFPLKLERRKGLIAYHRNIRLFFEQNQNRWDSVVLNEQDPVNIDMIKYAKKYGIPNRVIHAHNSGYGAKPSFLSRVSIALNKKVLGHYATTLLACSALAASFNFGRFKKRAIMIPNGVDCLKFRFDALKRKKTRETFGIDKQRLVVNVGRLDPQKNQFFLLKVFADAIKRSPDLQLIILGNGHLLLDLQRVISDLGLKAHAKIISQGVSPEDLYCAADLFVLPSLFEGLPVTLIEAQAAGLPSLVSSSVTREAAITAGCHFLSLEHEMWVKMIVDSETGDQNARLHDNLLVSESPFSAEALAQNLIKEYITL